MNSYDVLVIGAGACGLNASRLLAANGRKVLILEARDRPGGRIHTFNIAGQSAEAGAEFIHGDQPVTLRLLKEAGISYTKLPSHSMRWKNGQFEDEEEMFSHFRIVVKQAEKIDKDMPVHDFLQKFFPGKEHEDLRKSAIELVEGYETGDIHNASILSFKEAFTSAMEENQYIPEGGYKKLIHHLESQCRSSGAEIHHLEQVKEIRWEPDRIEIISSKGQYSAKKALITVSLGVLLENEKSPSYIQFSPPVEDRLALIKKMGFGSVIKIHLLFRERFWPEDMGFLFSESEIPTWWTQANMNLNLITGWIGGKKTEGFADKSDEEIKYKALNCLATIMGKEVSELQKNLEEFYVFDWGKDQFSLGAYSYTTFETKNVLKEVKESIQNTLYFAGEAFYRDNENGTVEAALGSGEETAGVILNSEF